SSMNATGVAATGRFGGGLAEAGGGGTSAMTGTNGGGTGIPAMTVSAGGVMGATASEGIGGILGGDSGAQGISGSGAAASEGICSDDSSGCGSGGSPRLRWCDSAERGGGAGAGVDDAAIGVLQGASSRGLALASVTFAGGGAAAVPLAGADPPRPAADNRTPDVLDPGLRVTTFDPPVRVKDIGMSRSKGGASPGGAAPRDSASEVGSTPKPLPDPAELSRRFAEIAEQSQRLVTDFLSRQNGEGGLGMATPTAIGAAFFEMTSRLMSDPSKLVEAQMSFWNDYLTLWQRTTQRMLGGEAEPVIEAPSEDRRFRDKAWSDNAVFDFIKQSHLLTARSIQSAVKNVEGLDDGAARKVDFYTRQFVDAIAPSNFVMTNPEVLRATIESRGENLLNGLKNLLGDLERGKGRLAISMTDMAAFKIGENVATTPGKVIYQNELIQLLQYVPTTKTVKRRPLLIMPPWIN